MRQTTQAGELYRAMMTRIDAMANEIELAVVGLALAACVAEVNDRLAAQGEADEWGIHPQDKTTVPVKGEG